MLKAELDLATTKEKIKAFIQRKVDEAQADGVVIGISGGIDSAVTAHLCVEALGSRRVLGLIMPDRRVTPEDDISDAHTVADELSIETKTIDIATIHRSYMKNLGPDRVAEGNLRARIRMALLYYYANLSDRLVVGTGDKSEALLGYFCYDSKTRVMTLDGPRHYWELEPGATVFSMNLENRRMEERAVESVHVFDYDGELIEANGEHIELLLTPNHRVLISRNHGKGPLAFRTAEGIFSSGGVSIPLPAAWSGATNFSDTVNLSDFLTEPIPTNANQPFPMKTADFLYLMGLFIGDGTNHVEKITTTVKSGMSRREYSSRKRDKLGHFKAIENPVRIIKTYDEPRIFIAAGEEKRSRKPLTDLLKRYEVNYSGTPTLVAFNNKALSTVFTECGHGAKQKRIPSWALKLPATALQHLFRGLMDSDGDAAGGAYTTTSPTLAYQMSELCFKLGLGARIKWRPPRTAVFEGKRIESSGYYDVRIIRKYRNFTLAKKDLRRIRYTGKVWCPSVPPHQNILVERNGKFVFCGNTKYGDGGADMLPIADLYKTEVRRLGEILGVRRRIVSKRSSPRLWPGQTAEGELGLSYDSIDSVFRMYLDQKLDIKTISSRLKIEQDSIKKLVSRYHETSHKRQMPEICKIR